MKCEIQPLKAADFQPWSSLFAEYCLSNRCGKEMHKIVTVWNWLIDPQHPMQGLIARNADGHIIGLAHFHSLPDALEGREMGYLANLYSKGHKANNVETALRNAFKHYCEEKGWG